MNGVKIKICGLFRPEDIRFVNDAKPDYCGFVINFPKSRRSVTPQQARRLCAQLAPEILPVGVFVDQPVEYVAALLRDGTLAGAQLHGNEDDEYLHTLRQQTGCRLLVKAFYVRDRADIQVALRSTADYILLDNGQGTGQCFDWRMAEKLPRPFFLAGGLAPHNLAQAVHQTHPWAVDMSSGVETGGVKDPHKIHAAVRIARNLDVAPNV